MLIFKFFPKDRVVLNWKGLKFSSSSLFGALSNAILELFGEKELYGFIEAFGKGEINVSSVFPLVRTGKGDILFLPRPIIPPDVDSEGKGSSSDSKKIKNITWLSLDVFFDFFKGIRYDDSDKTFRCGYAFSSNGIFWSDSFYASAIPLEIKEKPPFSSRERPHASIDRLNYTSNLFFTEEVVINYPLGFYFLCESQEVWVKKIKSAVKFLSDEGLGGGRSEGMGVFGGLEIEEKELFPRVKKVVGYVGLSVVYPLKDEVDKINSFSLVKDDGFVYMGGGRSIKKSRLMMLSEGSFYTGKVNGTLIEEKSGDVRIFRNGKAFLAPVGDLG